VADAASVRGAQQLEAVGRRLKGAAGAPLRRELLRGIRTGVKPTIPAIRESARSELPARGGLAALVAGSSFGVRTRLTGAGAGVRIQGTGRIGLASLNKGRLRHPVFGNRDVWVSQQVPEGWFDRPIEEDIPHIRAAVDRAMSDVSRKIEKG
jgi:hypothetical protein